MAEGLQLFSDKKGRLLERETLSFALADTHCHLSMLDGEKGSGDGAQFTDVHDALKRAHAAGLRLINCVSDPTEDARDPQAFYEEFKTWQQSFNVSAGEDLSAVAHISLSSGCHPHNARHYNKELEERLREMLSLPEVSSVGEIGLDYHYDFSPRELQRKAFEKQLELAAEFELPVALHLREAHDEAYEILRVYGLPPQGALLHCFNLGPHEFERFCELGCHFSIGGPVTFKSCEDLREALASAPLDRLMTETDAPYMAPAPLRGITCEPAFVYFTAAYLSELIATKQGMSFEAVGKRLYENALSFYVSKHLAGIKA